MKRDGLNVDGWYAWQAWRRCKQVPARSSALARTTLDALPCLLPRRSLNMASISAVGFDMDYTIASVRAAANYCSPWAAVDRRCDTSVCRASPQLPQPFSPSPRLALSCFRSLTNTADWEGTTRLYC